MRPKADVQSTPQPQLENTPRAVAQRAELAPTLPPGDDERISGYGVMGQSFASGDYLALRCMTAASFGPGYRSIWHRAPSGDWTVLSTTDPDHSCARYIAAACSSPSTHATVDVDWLDERTLHIRAGEVLEWTVAMTDTAVTRMLSRVGTAMPHWMWSSPIALALIGWVAGPMLGVGKVRLGGDMPNGQRYTAAPVQIWAIADSSATLHGRDLGAPKPLPAQARLADFWLPQRGIFMRAFAHFDPFDPARHVSGDPRQGEPWSNTS